ncbi:MAG: DNA-binding protein [Bacteroidales bacterium]|nr:DNA-binding protein [Candidatus Minthousia equi]
MINYSIVMRSVNSNLFEINQAKARIKQAEKDKVAPAQDDINLVATEKQNAYAIAQYTDVMTIEKFARHIATHGCVYSRADISAILYLAVDCMREQLLEGKKIRLGDLGDFSVSLTSKGAETADKFSAQNITGVNVNWECGSEFKNLIADAEFNLVASRKAQEAVLKAIKAGETTVDISTVGQQTGPSGDNVPGGTTTDNGQQTTDNGQQTGGNGGQTVNPGTGGSGDEDGLI